ncbi:MAG TPA: hypothetical protein VNV66_15105 [Pilimelia sp.]|nr:hypothetical protein [Pilimelia sp.]
MRRVLTAGWLVRHAVALVLVAGFLVLGWWQVRRAVGGNSLSWAYAFEWPLFAGFVVLVWVREIRAALRTGQPEPDAGNRAEPAPPAVPAPAGAAGFGRPVVHRPAGVRVDADDPELAEYNRFLAWLAAHPGARPADYPG